MADQTGPLRSAVERLTELARMKATGMHSHAMANPFSHQGHSEPLAACEHADCRLVREGLAVVRARQPTARFDLLEDPTRGLHAVLTNYGVLSRDRRYQSLVTALVHWAAEAYRSSQPEARAPQPPEPTTKGVMLSETEQSVESSTRSVGTSVHGGVTHPPTNTSAPPSVTQLDMEPIEAWNRQHSWGISEGRFWFNALIAEVKRLRQALAVRQPPQGRPRRSDICSSCGERADAHGDFGFRDHAFRDATGESWDIDWSYEREREAEAVRVSPPQVEAPLDLEAVWVRALSYFDGDWVRKTICNLVSEVKRLRQALAVRPLSIDTSDAEALTSKLYEVAETLEDKSAKALRRAVDYVQAALAVVRAPQQDLIAEMEDFLCGTDPKDARHIITAHWLSKVRAPQPPEPTTKGVMTSEPGSFVEPTSSTFNDGIDPVVGGVTHPPENTSAPQSDLATRLRFAFTDGLDGTELSEHDYDFVVRCMEQAIKVVLAPPSDPGVTQLEQLLESEAFYDAMQRYRTAPRTDATIVIGAYEAVKSLLRQALAVRQPPQENKQLVSELESAARACQSNADYGAIATSVGEMTKLALLLEKAAQAVRVSPPQEK